MTQIVPTPISAILRGVVFVVGGLACFAVVIAAALFAVGMTLVLVAARPIAAFRGEARADDAGQLEAAPVP